MKFTWQGQLRSYYFRPRRRPSYDQVTAIYQDDKYDVDIHTYVGEVVDIIRGGG